MGKDKPKTIKVGRRTIEVSFPDKVLFPDAGLRKLDIVRYYERISGLMLPLIKGRALTLRRAPRGLRGESWYEQSRPDWWPNWVGGVSLPRRSGGAITHVVCRQRADIVYLANQGCITLHAWLSQAADPERPDRLVFDFDPSDSGQFADVAFAAQRMRELLIKLGASPYLMTTGSRGLHVMVPLRPTARFAEVRELASRLCRRLADRYPDRLTVEHRKKKRRGRVFLDYLRNAYGQTAVAPYSVRLRPGAPVALPLDWAELPSLGSAQRYNVRNIGRRLARRSDPWAGHRRRAVALSALSRALSALEKGD